MSKINKVILVTEGSFRISPEGVAWLRARFQERGCTLEVSSDGYEHMSRHSPDLVQMVEALGESAGNFRVHQILGRRYILHRNIDGSERIETPPRHQKWTVIYGD